MEVQLKVKVSSELKDQAMEKAKAEGKTMKQVIDELLTFYVEGQAEVPFMKQEVPSEEVKFTQQAEPKEEVQLTSPIDDKYKKYGSGADLMRILDEADKAYWEE